MTADDAGYPSSGRAGYALGLLMTAAFTAMLDRFLIGLLIEPIRHDFAITDTGASLLQGLAFAVFYSVLGLPFGRLVDRSNRRNIIAGGVLFWSAMTVACGLAQNYPQLFIARLGVGVGEACLAPAAYSLITDYFHPRKHGRSLALFALISVVGGGSSFIVGAEVLAWITRVHADLPIGGDMAPWRLTFIFVGAPGVLVALLLLTVREPARRGRSASLDQPGWGELAAFMKSIAKPFACLTLAASSISIAGVGVTSWMAVFLSRTYGASIPTAGRWVGLMLIVSALVGGAIGGQLADSRRINAMKGGKFNLMFVGLGLALPFMIAYPLAPALGLSVALYLAQCTAYNIQGCTSPAMLQDLVPNRFKGQVSAIFFLIYGLIGGGLGSTIVALVTDHVFGDESMLRYSIIAVAVPCMLLAIMFTLIGRSSYQAARDRVAAEMGAAAPGPSGPTTAVAAAKA